MGVGSGRDITFTNENCLLALREASEELGNHFSALQYKRWRMNRKGDEVPSESTIVNRFGSWADAMIQAGFDYKPQLRLTVNQERVEVSLGAVKAYASTHGHWPKGKEWDEYAKEHGYLSHQVICIKAKKKWREIGVELGFDLLPGTSEEQQDGRQHITNEDCFNALISAAEHYNKPVTSLKISDYDTWRRFHAKVIAPHLVSICAQLDMKFTEATQAAEEYKNRNK